MTTNRPTWRPPAPRPRRPDVVVRGDPPLAEIAIYRDITILTRRSGATWRSHPISADALAQTFAKLPASSGLLPPHTLAAGRIGGQPMIVIYVPAQVRELHTEPRSYTIPLPPLVWAGCGQRYRIFSLNTPDEPSRESLPLMIAPFPNVYANGDICWGTSDPRPEAGPTTMGAALTTFFASYFNSHGADGKSRKFPVSVLAQWGALATRKAARYPLGDLQPAQVPDTSVATLGWLIEGRPWNT